jgi:RNA recognition motif. (a.k.a. RRM, RBD, or RNP domain)
MLQGDPFKTLFVGRLGYDVTEKRLRREFEEYGAIKSISIVHNIKSGANNCYSAGKVFWTDAAAGCDCGSNTRAAAALHASPEALHSPRAMWGTAGCAPAAA